MIQVSRHKKPELSARGENFFSHAIAILSLFTYSVCDEKVKPENSMSFLAYMYFSKKNRTVQVMMGSEIKSRWFSLYIDGKILILTLMTLFISQFIHKFAKSIATIDNELNTMKLQK